MIRVLDQNACLIEECHEETTPEGLMCRKHWSLVPGAVKAHYQSARKQALLAVRATEELKKRRDI